MPHTRYSSCNHSSPDWQCLECNPMLMDSGALLLDPDSMDSLQNASGPNFGSFNPYNSYGELGSLSSLSSSDMNGFSNGPNSTSPLISPQSSNLSSCSPSCSEMDSKNTSVSRSCQSCYDSVNRYSKFQPDAMSDFQAMQSTQNPSRPAFPARNSSQRTTQDFQSPAQCFPQLQAPELEDCGSLPCLTNFNASQSLSPLLMSQAFDLTSANSSDDQKEQRRQQQPEQQELPTKPQQSSRATHSTARAKSSSDTKTTRTASKQSHSAVERKYRENLSAKITQLHRSLASAQEPNDSKDGSEGGAADSQPKLRKGDVLVDATKFIKQAEVQKKGLEYEIQFLKSRVQSLERLVKCEECPLVQQLANLQMGASTSVGGY